MSPTDLRVHTRVDFAPVLAEVEQVEAKAGVAPVLAAIQQNKTLVDFAPASNCIASGIARRPSVLGRTKQPHKALERLANVQQLGLEPDGFMRHAAISTCGKASSLTRHRAPGSDAAEELCDRLSRLLPTGSPTRQ